MQNLKTKIAIAFFLSIAIVWVVAQQIPGVAINGPIVPMDARDVYSTMDPWWAAGVFRDATNNASLTNITAQRRLRGMLVYTSQDSKYWRLSNDLVTWVDISAQFVSGATNNIYNQNGSLTSDRTLSGANRALVMEGLTSLGNYANSLYSIGTNSIDLHSAVTTIEGRQQFYLQTPSVFGGAKVGNVLKLLSDGGGVTGLADFLPDDSIYYTDGTISNVARTVYISQGGTNPWNTGVTFFGTTNGGTMSGFFSAHGLGLINLFGRTNNSTATQEASIGSGSRVKFIAPANYYGTGTNGQVLMIVDATNSLVDFRPITNINLYTANGTLTGNRTVTGGGFDLTTTGVGTLNQVATTAILDGSSAIRFRTPAVRAATALAGQYLTLNNVNGTVEFTTLPAAPVTFYSGNGSISSTRTVSLTADLGFNYGGANSFQILNGNYFGLNMKTNVIYAPEEISIGTVSSGRFKLALPNSATSAIGDVPTLLTPASGLVEYRPPSNLYTANGTLTGDRLVTANSKLFSVTNASSLWLSAASGPAMSLDSTGALFDGKTTEAFAVIGSSVDFGYPNSPASYFTVKSAGNINFLGNTTPVQFVVTNISAAGISASTAKIRATNNLYLDSPAVVAGTATAGQVLTLKAGGDVDYANLPAAPVTLYSGDGSINSTRVVNLSANLTFNYFGANMFQIYNVGRIDMYSKTNAQYAPEEMSLSTAAAGRFKLGTAGTASGTANNGEALTLIDKSASLVEYRPSNVGNSMIMVPTMQALIAVRLNGLTTAQTEGYYTPGDGGGGHYSLITFAAGSTNWGNPQSSSDTSKMWKLQPSRDGGIWLKQYGAKGDGSTDDTLPMNYWLSDARGQLASISPGTYMSDNIGFQDGQYNIRGSAPVYFNDGSFTTSADGTVAVIKRRPGVTAPYWNIVGANTGIRLENVVFDGNWAADSANTNQYMYIQGGSSRPSYLKNVVVRNTSGHGIGVSGGQASELIGCRVYNVGGRGIRFNGVSLGRISDCFIYGAYENGLSLVNCLVTKVTDTRVSDCGVNGVIIDSCDKLNARGLESWGNKQACLRIAGSASWFTFNECNFHGANAQSNFVTAVTGAATRTYPFIYVDANVGSAYTARINFNSCNIGAWWPENNGSPWRYGTNEVSVPLQWVGSNAGQPWYNWSFANCEIKWIYWQNLGAAHFSPEINRRENTVFMGTRDNNDNIAFNFGGQGSVVKTNGWAFENVATAASNQPLQVNGTTHVLTTTGTTIAPAVAPTSTEEEFRIIQTPIAAPK